jgi:signal transduction histidine kinase
MKPSRNRSFSQKLAFKVGGLAVLLMVVVLGVFTFAFITMEKSEEKEGILENGQTFARFAADSIYDDYVQYYTQPLPEQFERFKERINETLEANKDIEGFTLMSVNGRILFDSEELEEGKYSGPARSIEDETTLNALKNDEMTIRTLPKDTEEHSDTEIIVPLIEPSGGHVLSMRYVLSYGTLETRLSEIYQRSATLALVMLVFVVAAALVFAQRLSRPIVRLKGVAEQIRGGNLTARATLKRKDEIGDLAIAINDMADKLKGYYETLEAKVQDRTKELQAAQTQLLENVKQDEALLASIGDGVIATDKSGHIIWMNKPAEDMLQVNKGQILGKMYEEIWQLETEKGSVVPEEEQPIYQAFKTGQSVRSSQYYYARKDKDGKPIVKFAVAVTVAPVMLNDQVIGMINVFRDVTHERQVDRMKTEFISLASHQLRTPLSAIRWFTEMLLSGDAGELSEEQKDFTKNIYDSADRMIELVNSLLNISRIESGRIIVDPKPTDLGELVGGVVNDLKAKTEQKQQTLIVSVHKDLPKVNLDPRLIGQVYMNFLTNAIKYTPKSGEISVFVSRKGEELVSQITDNGYGIPKEQQKRVFEKFFRAENIVKVETDGTGLGLYLVKAIIESSGGRVWFESEEGKGTTFWFTLPMSGMKAREGEVTLDA